MGLSDLTIPAVSQAIEEFDQLKRKAFLKKYGFGQARGYLVVKDGRTYDSKAIAGAAHGYLPGSQPLGILQARQSRQWNLGQWNRFRNSRRNLLDGEAHSFPRGRCPAFAK